MRAVEGPGEHYRQLTAQLLAAEDAARNREGGFWVAGNDPVAASHALTGAASPGPLVVMSDGLLDIGVDFAALLTAPLQDTVLAWRAGLSAPIDDITVARATA